MFFKCDLIAEGELRGEVCRRMQVYLSIFLKTAKMLFCKVKLFCGGRCIKTLVVSMSGVIGR